MKRKKLDIKKIVIGLLITFIISLPTIKFADVGSFESYDSGSSWDSSDYSYSGSSWDSDYSYGGYSSGGGRHRRFNRSSYCYSYNCN